MNSYLNRQCGLEVENATLTPELLDQPQVVSERLGALEGMSELQQLHFPKSEKMLGRLQSVAWAGNGNLESAGKLLEDFAERKNGEGRLNHLLDLLPAENLPTPSQVELFARTPAVVKPGEFAWLTEKPDEFDLRLELMKKAKDLLGTVSLETYRGMDNEARLLAMTGELESLSGEEFQQLVVLKEGDYERFRQTREQLEADHLEGFAELWKDAPPDWNATREKLLTQGLDGRRAALAAAALGKKPSEELLALAGKLTNDKDFYGPENPYVSALKHAAGLPKDFQEDFGVIFNGVDLKDWRPIWGQTEKRGKVRSPLVESLKILKARGVPLGELPRLTGSTDYGERLLSKLREDPDESAWRRRAWVQYTSRKVESCRAAVVGASTPSTRDVAYLQHWQTRLDELLSGVVPEVGPPTALGVPYPGGMP